MLFKSKKVIGIDVGASFIKLAEVDTKGNSATLTKFAMIETPRGSFVGSEVTDMSAIGSTIRQVISEYKFKRKSGATGISGSSVVVKKITIPRMETSLIADQIRWEAEQYIPYELTEVNLDYHIIKGSTAPDTMDILLTAAKHDQIFKYVEIVESSGVSCSHLDVTGFALANSFLANYGQTGGSSVLLVDIGSVTTNLVVIKGGDILFNRDIPIGGDTYTSEIQKSLSITHSEAEGMKLSFSRGEASPPEIAEIVQANHSSVVEELVGNIDFFKNTVSDENFSKFYITGGGSKISGLRQMITQSINYQCDTFDPFFNVKCKKKVFSSSYIEQIRDFAGVSIGLGLRGVSDT